MGEKTMITGGDTEAGEHEHHEEHAEVEPVEAKEPEVDRQCGHGKERRPDEERAGDPIDSIEWNA